MVYLFLDTNLWLQFYKKKYFEFFEDILSNVNDSEMVILSNEVIELEFSRNESGILSGIDKQVSDSLKQLKFIKSFVSEDYKSRLIEIIEGINKEKDVKIAEFQKRFQKVRKLLLNETLKIPVSEEVKNEVLKLGINNRKPFFENKKNGINDAIHFYSTCEFIVNKKNKGLNKVIFVSENVDDFAAGKERDKRNTLHPELQDYLAIKQIDDFEYSSNIAEVFKLNKEFQEEIDKRIDLLYWNRIKEEEEEMKRNLFPEVEDDYELERKYNEYLILEQFFER